jgi:hypothetical protein
MTTTTATRKGIPSVDLDFWVEIEDGPVVTVRFPTHNGKQFKVDRAHIKYMPIDGQWRLRFFRVWGQALKKDGTVGKLEVSNEYTSMENAPDWVREIAEHFRPKQEAPKVTNSPVTVTL